MCVPAGFASEAINSISLGLRATMCSCRRAKIPELFRDTRDMPFPLQRHIVSACMVVVPHPASCQVSPQWQHIGSLWGTIVQGYLLIILSMLPAGVILVLNWLLKAAVVIETPTGTGFAPDTVFEEAHRSGQTSQTVWPTWVPYVFCGNSQVRTEAEKWGEKEPLGPPNQ